MATIEIDGNKIEVDSGKMVIEAADDAGITIPRFCYHKKLSVAANCRMCLVEIEKIGKPMPACATPVTDGMKVFTKSEMAISAQKAVMEFLLINHPLDCPICDQGGECELQDVSLGYGKDYSQFDEQKRAVEDDDLGSLIATDMTRCIHCTRCVRFGEEVAGLRELGVIGRGEKTEIGTYIKHSVRSEVSGNVIDLCPVGALTSKPYRFTARPWELQQLSSIAGHDCLGSNINVHVRRNEVMRVVPKENEAINETWLSDRDRFSYKGLNCDKRLIQPKIKINGKWKEVDWQEALTFTVKGIKKVIDAYGADEFAALCSPSVTIEEAYLLQKLMRRLGVNNLDHRIHQTDFSDQSSLPTAPIARFEYAKISEASTIFLLGSNLQKEQPLAGLRVRKAVLKGAKVSALNVVDYPFNFDVAAKCIVSPQEIVSVLAKITAEVTADFEINDEAKKLLLGFKADKEAKKIATILKESESPVIILGAVAQNHLQSATIRTLVDILEKVLKANVITMTEGANAAGCWMAGMVPHRGAFGEPLAEQTGEDIQKTLQAKKKGYLLHGIEPSLDIANPHNARLAMLRAEFVVMLHSFESDAMHDYADVLLPISPFTETSGTFVNVEGTFQSFKGLIEAKGQTRPAWKVLRVLANIFDFSDFEYLHSAEVLDEIKRLHAMVDFVNKQWYCPPNLEPNKDRLARIGEWPMNRIDAICRHALPLQRAASSEVAIIRIHPETAARLRVANTATIAQNEIEITLPLELDDTIAKEAFYVANAMPETIDLGDAFGLITIKR